MSGPRVRWDVHTDKVSRRAKRWATTDCGWLFRDGETTSLGHYLDYGPCSERYRAQPEGSVHAVSCVTRVSQWFKTVEEAQKWIEAQAGVAVTRRAS